MDFCLGLFLSSFIFQILNFLFRGMCIYGSSAQDSFRRRKMIERERENESCLLSFHIHTIDFTIPYIESVSR